MPNFDECGCECHEPNAKNAPPDLFSRLQMFMDLSQEYLELVPRTDSKILGIPTDSSQGRKLRRLLILFYSEARKFFSRDEQVSLRKINNEILREHGSNLPDIAVKTIRDDQRFYSRLEKTLFDVQTLVIQNAKGEVVGNVQEVYNVMYGRVLHADYPKWSNAQWSTSYTQLQKAMASVRELLWSMRSNVAYMFDEGLLPNLQFKRAISEDVCTPVGEYISTENREHYELNI